MEHRVSNPVPTRAVAVWMPDLAVFVALVTLAIPRYDVLLWIRFWPDPDLPLDPRPRPPAGCIRESVACDGGMPERGNHHGRERLQPMCCARCVAVRSPSSLASVRSRMSL